MAKYRARPIVIEAIQFVLNETDPGAARCTPVMVALDDLGCDYESWRFSPDGVEIPTLEGTMLASPGDYIVKGTHGEFYPVKPHIFELKYELV